MSALAVLAKAEGHIVAGSDSAKSEQTNMLKENGVAVFEGSFRENISVFTPDLVVISGAIHKDNEEWCYAVEHAIPCMSRGEFLGETAKRYDEVIAVTGSHGKTTTTALIAEMFLEAGLNPTIHLGGVLKKIGSNVRVGGRKFFITEACEYQNAYHHLFPTVGIITNVEADHLDFFGNLENVKRSFAQFTSQCREVVLPLGEQYQSNLAGKHNQKNISCAVQTAKKFNISDEVIQTVLSGFGGVKRRFDHIGVWRGKPVIHDYAHHPTEIAVTLKMTEEFAKKWFSSAKKPQILTVFQPHTYSRTAAIFEQFVDVFGKCSHLFLYKTYPARESEECGLSALDLCKELQKRNAEVRYFTDYETMRETLLAKMKDIDLILILGAGDIETFGDFLLKNP